MSKINSSKIILAFLFILAISCFLIFYRYTSLPIQYWDESRLALNAFEMSINKNYLVTHFAGEPEMWNTKPPLMIWAMTVSMNCWGYNEFAVRFPTALSILATIIFLFFYIYKKSYELTYPIWTILILLTSVGYMGFHVARTGDYDAMLTLWITLYSLAYFEYLHNDNNNKYLLIFFITFVLSVFTKGIAGCMMLPALLIYTIFCKKVLLVIKDKNLYIFSAISIFLILGYYFMREHYNHGYLQAVIENEITGRYTKINEDHGGPFNFYLVNMYNTRFSPWIFALPIALISTFYIKNSELKKLSAFAIVCILVYLLIISISYTKLEWYDAPLFPFLAIVTGSGLVNIFLLCKNTINFNNIASIGASVLLFSLPVLNLFDSEAYKINAPSIPAENYRLILEQVTDSKTDLKSFKILNETYNPSLMFYINAYNMKGYSLEQNWLWEDLNKGDYVLAPKNDYIKFLTQKYESSPIIVNEKFGLFKIEKSKDK